MLASDTMPMMLALVVYFLAVCILSVVVGVVVMLLIKRWPSIGLVFGVLSCIFGGWLLLYMRDAGANFYVFWLFAFLPLVSGIACLARWIHVKTTQKQF
jgi:hypothetical protein